MDERIYTLAKEINLKLKNHPLFVRLDELEKELNNNEEVMRLAYIKDNKCTIYSDALKIYDENNENVIKARKELNQAKIDLDNHPLVKEYNKVYSEVSQILFEMNEILLEDIKKEGNC